MPDQTDHNRAWSLNGFPMTWGPNTMKEWLISQGCKIETLKPPATRQKAWSLQGFLPGHPLAQSFACEIECSNGHPCHAMISRWKKVRKADEKEDKRIAGYHWCTHDDKDPIQEMLRQQQTFRLRSPVRSLRKQPLMAWRLTQLQNVKMKQLLVVPHSNGSLKGGFHGPGGSTRRGLWLEGHSSAISPEQRFEGRKRHHT